MTWQQEDVMRVYTYLSVLALCISGGMISVWDGLDGSWRYIRVHLLPSEE